MGRNIRTLSTIPHVLAHMYTYGFFTREDFVREGLVGSTRAYDNIIRRLRDLYFLDSTEPERAAVVVRTDGKRRFYQFRRDYFNRSGRLMEAAFGLHSLSEDAAAILIICLSLAARPCGVTVAEAARTAFLKSGTPEGENRTATVSRRLKSLLDAGYLRREGQRYFSPDSSGVLDNLSDEELTRLWYLASFYAGCGYPRVSAAFLRDALRRRLFFRGLPEPGEAFLFRDSPCGNMLDEPVVWDLERCRRLARKALISEKGRESTVLPVFLRPDKRYGRWYLMGVRDGEPTILRVSSIDEAQMLDETFSFPEARKLVEDAFRYNYISSRRSAQLVRVEAELFFGEDSAPVRQQFEREIIFGGIERRDGREFYCAEVSDPTELRPLLRAYGPWLRILPGEGHSLDREIREEYERMLRQYEPVQ